MKIDNTTKQQLKEALAYTHNMCDELDERLGEDDDLSPRLHNNLMWLCEILGLNPNEMLYD